MSSQRSDRLIEIIDEGTPQASLSSPLSSNSSHSAYRLFDSDTSVFASGGESTVGIVGYDRLMKSLLYKTWLLDWNFVVTVGLSIFTIFAIVVASMTLPDSAVLVPMLNTKG